MPWLAAAITAAVMGADRLPARAVGHLRAAQEIDRSRRNDAFPQGDDPVAQEPERDERSQPLATRPPRSSSEIERTRVEMSETLGEIQERLRPDHLMQQAKDDGVTEAATGKVRNIMNSAGETATMVADQTKYAGRTVADYVRTHPVQMAMVAGGITWWLLRGRDRSDEWEGASEGWQDTGHRLDTDYDTDYAYRDRSLREKVGEYASTARETVGGYAASARETVSDAARSGALPARVRRPSASAARRRPRRCARRKRGGAPARRWTTGCTNIRSRPAPLPWPSARRSASRCRAPRSRTAPWAKRAIRRSRRRESPPRQVKENVTQKVQNVAESVLDDVTAHPDRLDHRAVTRTCVMSRFTLRAGRRKLRRMLRLAVWGHFNPAAA